MKGNQKEYGKAHIERIRAIDGRTDKTRKKGGKERNRLSGSKGGKSVDVGEMD